MAPAYLNHRELGELEKADFLEAEIIDQCVRTVPVGKMGRLFQVLSNRHNSKPGEPDPHSSSLKGSVK
jgi:hypothetical protein